MELDLKKIVSLFMSKIWFIISAAIVGGIVFFVINAYFVVPQYTSSALLYVSNMSERKSSVVTTSDVAVSKELVDTCVVILNSRTVLDKVAEQSGLPYSSSKIKSMIKAESVSSTEVFRISVTHTDPNEAQVIADAILRIAPGEIKRVINGGAVSIIDYATLPLSPSSPNIPRNTVLGALLAAILTMLVILVRNMFDTRIKSEFTLVENFELPIIGAIPSFKLAQKSVSSKSRRKKAKEAR